MEILLVGLFAIARESFCIKIIVHNKANAAMQKKQSGQELKRNEHWSLAACKLYHDEVDLPAEQGTFHLKLSFTTEQRISFITAKALNSS